MKPHKDLPLAHLKHTLYMYMSDRDTNFLRDEKLLGQKNIMNMGYMILQAIIHRSFQFCTDHYHSNAKRNMHTDLVYNYVYYMYVGSGLILYV